MNSFFECITQHPWYHRQKPTIPPLSLGVDLVQVEILMIKQMREALLLYLTSTDWFFLPDKYVTSYYNHIGNQCTGL